MCEKDGKSWEASSKQELKDHMTKTHYMPTYRRKQESEKEKKETRLRKKKEKAEKNGSDVQSKPVMKAARKTKKLSRHKAEQEFREQERRDAAGRN